MTTVTNLYILEGNLGHDIEVRESKGYTYTHFRVATDKDVPNGNGGFESRVTWVRVTAFGPLARSLACLGKGSEVLVRAHLDEEVRDIGGTRYPLPCVIADEVKFLRVKKSGDASPEEDPALAIPPRTLERWRTRGGGPPFVRVGRHVRYRFRDLQAWIESRTFKSTSEADRSN